MGTAAMKLIIQIPCLNEEDSLPVTLADLPREVPGFDTVEWLVIDDGSTDRTIDVACASGADHVVRLSPHQGLARAFRAGLDAALELGADVIVNTDADHQYRGADIPALTRPILAGEADVVVGDRRVAGVAGFSPAKRALQRVGSWVVRRASGTSVPDTTSGLRAYDRRAASALRVVSRFTYTLETIVQAGRSGMAITHVPVGTNPQLRPSRLFGSTSRYVWRSAISLLRSYATYGPLRVPLGAAAGPAVPGGVIAGRPTMLEQAASREAAGP